MHPTTTPNIYSWSSRQALLIDISTYWKYGRETTLWSLQSRPYTSAPTKSPLQSVDPPPKAGILWAHLEFQSWLIFFKVVRPRFGGSKADRILLGWDFVGALGISIMADFFQGGAPTIWRLQSRPYTVRETTLWRLQSGLHTIRPWSKFQVRPQNPPSKAWTPLQSLGFCGRTWDFNHGWFFSRWCAHDLEAPKPTVYC